jgi:hypothetical protein
MLMPRALEEHGQKVKEHKLLVFSENIESCRFRAKPQDPVCAKT